MYITTIQDNASCLYDDRACGTIRILDIECFIGSLIFKLRLIQYSFASENMKQPCNSAKKCSNVYTNKINCLLS